MHRLLFCSGLSSRAIGQRSSKHSRRSAGMCLNALHVDWRQHFVNNRTADTMTGLQNRFWFLVKAQPTRRSDASRDR
jgi:hypothetical protein